MENSPIPKLVIENISQNEIQFTFNSADPGENHIKFEENIEEAKSSSRISQQFSSRTSNISYVLETFDNPEMNIENIDSSSEDSVRFEPISMFVGGIEHMSTPFDYIFSNRSILRLKILIEDAEKEVEVSEKGCFFNIFKCIKSNHNPEKQEFIEKTVKLAKSYFDDKISLHGNLIMSWYAIITGRTIFRLEKGIWHLLGFSSEEPRLNGLNLQGVPMVLLHLIYMNEKFPNIMQEFKSHCLNPNTSGCLIQISSIILKGTLQIFESSSFSRILVQSNDRPLSHFLSLQTGLTILWCQVFDKTQEKRDLIGILKNAMKSIKDINQVLNLVKVAEANQAVLS